MTPNEIHNVFWSTHDPDARRRINAELIQLAIDEGRLNPERGPWARKAIESLRTGRAYCRG